MSQPLRILPTILGLLLVVATLSGCGLTRSWFGPKYTVPEKTTPREQSQVADRQLREAQQNVDTAIRREAMKKTIAAFKAVSDRFPDDRVYTPAALLMQGDLHYQIQEYRRAEASYREVISRYPTIEDVHASALLGLGETLYQQNRNREGNETLSQLVEAYARSENPAIQARVRRAKSQMDRVR